jgi:hypothetical protein
MDTTTNVTGRVYVIIDTGVELTKENRGKLFLTGISAVAFTLLIGIGFAVYFALSHTDPTWAFRTLMPAGAIGALVAFTGLRPKKHAEYIMRGLKFYGGMREQSPLMLDAFDDTIKAEAEKELRNANLNTNQLEVFNGLKNEFVGTFAELIKASRSLA